MKLLPLVSTGHLPAARQEKVFGEAGERASLAGVLKLVVVIMATFVAVLGSGTSWFIDTHSDQAADTQQGFTAGIRIPNAEATATANTILSDPLNQNIHNWPVGVQGSGTYVFQGGAYDITDNVSQQVAPAILAGVPKEIFSQPFAYTLTMQELEGDDTSAHNSFGMIIHFSKQGGTITTFYSFEVVNTNGGEYQFWKFDDSQGAGASPWTKLWHLAFGQEFHAGHGLNTFKVFMNGSTCTFIVNGKKVGTTQVGSVTSGAVGMLVNLKGTRVAFSNLVLTHN